MDQAADRIEAFIARWQDVGGRERANYQLFLTELAALLDLPTPEPATCWGSLGSPQPTPPCRLG